MVNALFLLEYEARWIEIMILMCHKCLFLYLVSFLFYKAFGSSQEVLLCVICMRLILINVKMIGRAKILWLIMNFL